MWTYKTPYTPEERTRAYIEKRGRLALSRALNIGRVVGFVASGATMGYGHPSWTGLVKEAVALALDHAETAPKKDGAIRAAEAGLKRLKDNGGLKNQQMQALGLAESLSRMLGKQDEFRETLAEFFSRTRNTLRDPNGKQTSANILQTEGFDSTAEPLRALISDLRVSRLLTLNYDAEIEEEFHRLYRTSGTSRDRIKPRVYRMDDNKVKKQDPPETAFDVLCGGDFERARDVPRRVEYSDGTSRSVLSVSMSGENIADLVNFSVQPRQFMGQVVHLHGRYDKPQDMVLTDEDYRRTYLKSDEQAQTFEEALSALLTGNDILFVGSGMREADILRPLRQFISQDKTPDFAKRFVFALLENKVTLDKRFLENSQNNYNLIALKKDFRDNHLEHPQHSAPTQKGAAMDDYCTDESDALRLHGEFGVLALFHGGQRLRTVLLAIKLLEAARPDPKNPTVPTDDSGRPAFIAAASALMESLATIRTNDDALLSDTECEKLTEYLQTLVDDLNAHRLPTALPSKPLLEALTNEVRSRALTRALQEMEDERSKWWEDWRARPKERGARFRPYYLKGDTNKKIPALARHRPVYDDLPAGQDFRCMDQLRKLASNAASAVDETCSRYQTRPSATQQVRGGHIRRDNTNDMSYFRHAATPALRDFAAVPPRRIVRACMPRGTGKGALLHILQQPVDTGNRLHLDTLFDGLQGNRYHGAFCLHLSFSMEFASAISALSEFVEYALIGAMVEYPGGVLSAIQTRLQAPLPGHDKTFLGLLHANPDAIVSALKTLQSNGGPTNKTARKTCADSLTKILQTDFWGKLQDARGISRLHRLEKLRMRISAFTDIVDLLKDQNLRLLIVMSGMDKLCDDTGTAYNPMFRGLFRLLTGCGAKYASESDVTAPIDYLLISGTRHQPIRYLTDERGEAAVREAVATPGHGAPLDFIARELDRGTDRTPLFLQDWPILPAIGMDERCWIRGDAEAFRQKLFDTNAPDTIPHIERACRNGVALSSWCAGAYRALAEGTGASAPKGRLTHFVKRLDDAAMRGEMAEILRELLEVHKVELRAWGARLNADLRGRRKADPNWPRPGLRTDRDKVPTAEAQKEEANRMVELTYLVLSHLALFPMPVEPRVLYGCNEVRDALIRICDPVPVGKLDAQMLARLRLRRLRLLSQLLDYLHKSHLVIAVRAKPYTHPLVGRTGLKLGRAKRSADDIHTRFTIQHQLRDFVARLMDLSVPDQGERNFFQVSIYCDQPSDLPSPNEEHYRMVKGIMEQQVTQVRHTTWCLMKMAQAHAAAPGPLQFDALTAEDQELVSTGLTRRFYRMAGDAPAFDPDLPAIHAVPQRVRALYGLLRGGFSIGTISRLTSLGDVDDDQPYERFRGWLRGVTNAAMGWDYAIDKLFLDKDDAPDLGKSLTALKALHDHVNDSDKVPPDTPAVVNLPHMLTRPLYRDEIGWLLNERGLVALVTGHIFDAIPLFQRALDAMHHDDAEGFSDPSLHAAVRRVRLNLAIALIERGQLGRARTMLNGLRLPSAFSAHGGSQVSWMAEGYLGLIDHLGGNHAVAEKRYAATIARAQDRDMLRLAAIFLRHRADLKRRQKQLDEAATLVEQAVSIAQKSAQRDIYHLSSISQAMIAVEMGGLDVQRFHDNVTEAYLYGQSMGIPRLESEALRLQSAMFLRQGERMLGGTFASRAAAIANRHGLRLTKLAALFNYGLALHRRGQTEAARQILSEALREAERRGYQNMQQADAIHRILPDRHARGPGR